MINHLNRLLAAVFILLLPLLGFGQDGVSLSIRGTIQSESLVPLPSANIVVPGTTFGTVSNLNGWFELEILPADTVKLLVTYIGYLPKTVTLARDEIDQQPIRVLLTPVSLSFSPVEIIGEKTLEQLQLIEPSLRIYRGEEMAAIHSIGGPDVFRAIQALPGVQSSSELSNQLYIRGGTPDQNLVLVNGVPVYQPFHLFGLTSSVDAAAVDYVKYYSGGFSVRYGDRLSGVLDIVTKPGSDSLSARVDWNFINAGATIAGPLGKRWRWRITGRRTYFDYLVKLADQDFPYHYYDLEGKISYLPTPRHLFTLNTFISRDDHARDREQLRFNPHYEHDPNPAVAYADSNRYWKKDRNSIDWTNRLVSLRWLGRHSERALTEVTFYFSGLSQGLDNLRAFIAHDSASTDTRNYVDYMNEEYRYNPYLQGKLATTNLNDIGATIIHEWKPFPSLETVFGGSFSKREMTYRWNTADFDVISPYINVFMDFPPDSMDYDLSLSTTSGFTEVIYQHGATLWLRGGLRADHHSVYGKWTVSPRMNLTWKFLSNWHFKAGLGRFHQSLSSSVEYGFYSVASIYFPTKGPVPSATHLLAGLIYDNTRNLMVDMAWYHKNFDQLLYIRRDGSVHTGPGVSDGLELLLTFAPKPRTSTQLAYAYTVVRKTQMGETFYPNYDQRHKLHSTLNISISRARELNLTWSFSTGRPANLATMMFYSGIDGHYRGDTIVQREAWPFMMEMSKNVFRYPLFHRLDVSIRKERQRKNGTLTTYLQIMNIYARSNVMYYEDVEDHRGWFEEPDGTRVKKLVYKVKAFNGFPLLPTLGFSYEF